MRNYLQTITFLVFLTIILILVFVVFVTPSFAQPPTEYQTISPLPGSEKVKADDPGAYFGNIFKLFVAVISILAVIKLMICGFQYMTSEAIGSKENAKKCIWAIILGLFIILLSFLILKTINPELTKLQFDVLKQNITPSGSAPQSGGPGGDAGGDAGGGPPNTSPTPTPIGQPPAGSTLVGNVVECERPSISVVNACETLDSEQAKCISGGCTWSSIVSVSVCAC